MTMYLEHFGLTEAPFKITPHTEFFFAGANRGETLEGLIYAITSGEGMVKVTGEVGAGKTMLCRVLMERLPVNVETIYLAVPSLSRDEMLSVIAGDLGIEPQGGNTTLLIRALQERLIDIHAQGKQVVALIDEAHAMPLETLEEIRLLSNLETSRDKLMQIVLFGQPELDQHLMLPHMRQLKERITHSFKLLPLPARDIRDYLDFRLRAAGYKGPHLFGSEALKLIAEASEGLTRRINIYADKTLLAAYASGTHNITADHVRAAVSDTQIVLTPSSIGRGKLWMVACAALSVGALIGFAGARYWSPKTADAAPARPVEMPLKPILPASPGASSPQPAPTATAGEQEARTSAAGNVPAQDTPQPAISPQADVVAGRALPLVAVSEKPADKAADWLQARMIADLARLRGFPDANFAVQLMTADPREKSAIEAFLRSASSQLDAERIMIYPAGTRENPRLSVLYGNYAGRVEANAEIARLPAQLSRFAPYARSMQSIRDDVRSGF